MESNHIQIVPMNWFHTGIIIELCSNFFISNESCDFITSLNNQIVFRVNKCKYGHESNRWWYNKYFEDFALFHSLPLVNYPFYDSDGSLEIEFGLLCIFSLRFIQFLITYVFRWITIFHSLHYPMKVSIRNLGFCQQNVNFVTANI